MKILGIVSIIKNWVSPTTTFCWSVELDRAFFYAPRPLIDRAPGNDVTSLTTYTTHTRVGDTRIYIIYNIYIYIVRTRGKAIIGMAIIKKLQYKRCVDASI